MQTSLDNILAEQFDCIFLLGDFNDRCRTWHGDHASTDLGLRFYQLIEGYRLTQIITDPTRYTDDNAHLLDLIITDSPLQVLDSGTRAPLSKLDHCIVYCKLNLKISHPRSYQRQVWDYKFANVIELDQAIRAAPFDSLLHESASLNDAVTRVTDLFISTCKEHIPNKTVTIRPKNKKWLTNDVRRAFRRRDRLFKRQKLSQRADHRVQYEIARREANRVKRLAIRRYQIHILSTLSNKQTSQKTVYSLSKALLGSKSTSLIPALVEGNVTITQEVQKANLLNNYFVEQCTIPISTVKPTLPQLDIPPTTIVSIQTSPKEIENLLKALNVKKASGPDGISNFMLKHTSNAFSITLAKIINSSLDKGIFPDCWKRANVSPVFKKNDKQSKKNYRPISLLPGLSKIIERVVYKQLYEYCSANNYLNERNSGFKKNDSTTCQLLHIVNEIYTSIDKGDEVCVVFLDVSKAFDRVWHEGLLYKLKRIGVSGALLRWFESYLTGRKQRVVVQGSSSDWKSINAGVPQGSILGPLLFLVYISDISLGIRSDINLFADDTSLMKTIFGPQCFQVLNTDLDTLHKWSVQWLVEFNAEKSVHMLISKKRKITNHPPLLMNGKIIKKVVKHCHLGLTLTNTISWKEHIKNLSIKANRRLYLLRKIRNIVPRKCLINLYFLYVRSALDYCDIIYDACTKEEASVLESIQRKAAVICTGAFRRTSTRSLLHELGWNTLGTRRRWHRLNMLYKILAGLAPPYLNVNHQPQVQNTYNLRNNKNLRVPFARTTIAQRSFFPQTIREWNSLDCDIRKSVTYNIFKSRMHKLERTPTSIIFSHGYGLAPKLHCRLRLELSALNDHRFKHNFGNDRHCELCIHTKEDNSHFLLNCPRYAACRTSMLSQLSNMLCPGVNMSVFINACPMHITKLLLNGSKDVEYETNVQILIIAFNYIIKTLFFVY
jgi:hypothetical protein